jgi:hypothetical protein
MQETTVDLKITPQVGGTNLGVGGSRIVTCSNGETTLAGKRQSNPIKKRFKIGTKNKTTNPLGRSALSNLRKVITVPMMINGMDRASMVRPKLRSSGPRLKKVTVSSSGHMIYFLGDQSFSKNTQATKISMAYLTSIREKPTWAYLPRVTGVFRESSNFILFLDNQYKAF